MEDNPPDPPPPPGRVTVPVKKFDWQRLVFRLEESLEFKGAALCVSLFADADGSNVRPGRDLVADGIGRSTKVAGEYLGQLVGMGLLTVTRRGGGRGGHGDPTVYRLSAPPANLDGSHALPMRLDQYLARLTERPAGRRPQKAIEASLQARAKRFDVKPGSPQSGAVPAFEEKPTTGGTPEAPFIEVNQASRQNAVDNPYEEKPATPQSPVDNLNDVKPTSHENDFHEKNPALPCVADDPLRCSPATHYQVTSKTKTQSHLSLVGNVTSTPDPQPADPPPAATPAALDAAYEAALAALHALAPRHMEQAMAAALTAFAAEGLSTPSSRQLVLRAAALAAASRTATSNPSTPRNAE